MADDGVPYGASRASGGMECAELVELVTDYLEGALSAEETRRFDAHLAVCDGCAAYLDQVRTTVRLLGRLPAESLTPAARAALLEAFRDWNRH